ncbi:MAG: MAPEG family protein [Marinosulfonomonas sp.]|nr:MAPEG family protein [Marinosulfonomonas sp.]
MILQITALYGALLGTIMIALSFFVSSMRGKTGISIGDGGDMAMLESMRRHGNFTEIVPMAVILMGLAEVQGAGSGWLHAVGVLLVVGRVAHPLGLSASKMMSPLRIVGSLGTTVAVLISIVLILIPVLGF